MNEMKTWQNVDKSGWEDGQWKSEPDKAQWVSHGLDCLIVRNPYGALCGYVGVPESHQSFEKEYEYVDVDVHGGLTFSNRCNPNPEGDHKGVCHVEEGAANKTVWWLGFDCAHYDDFSPKTDNPSILFGEGTYKDFNYVTGEVESLAKQLSV